MTLMNVSVPDSLRDWVQRRIKSGEYASEGEYVCELIRRDQKALSPQLSVEDVRRSIEGSRIEDCAVPADEVFDRLEAKLKEVAG